MGKRRPPRGERAKRCVAAMCAGVVILVAVRRSEASPSATLVVARDRGAETCPGADELTRAVNRKLGGDSLATAADAPATRVSVVITGRGDERHADVVALGERAGRRSLDDPGPSCAGLSAALVLTLALLLDPSAPAPPVEPPPPPAPIEPPRPAFRNDLALTVGGGGAVGVLTAPAPAVFAGATLGLAPHWSTEIGGAWLPARHESFGDGDIGVLLVSSVARVCRRHVLGDGGAFDASLCGEFWLGALHGSAGGYASEHDATRPWVSVGGAALFDGPIEGPLGWRVALEATTPLADESFSVAGVGQAYRPARVGSGASVGLRVRLR